MKTTKRGVKKNRRDCEFGMFFPPQGRIKRIMQADEEVGKIAQAVPVIISRTLELFVESLLTKSSSITSSRNASEFLVRNHFTVI
jgi:Histone-like transcription factor (CBF/NF-Y) and archaeal histone